MYTTIEIVYIYLSNTFKQKEIMKTANSIIRFEVLETESIINLIMINGRAYVKECHMFSNLTSGKKRISSLKYNEILEKLSK